MALVGDLKDLKLPSLIQLNCMEKNTAKLTIETDGRYGFVYFENGQVVHAEYDPEIGEEAVYRMLHLYSGKFKVESGIRAPAQTIRLSWNSLLLEGLHKLDDGDADPSRRYDHLFERLLTIKGVIKALVINEVNEVIASSNQGKAFPESFYFFLNYEAQKIGELLQLEAPEIVTFSGGFNKFALCAFNKYLVVIELESKTKTEVILPFIRQALR